MDPPRRGSPASWAPLPGDLPCTLNEDGGEDSSGRPSRRSLEEAVAVAANSGRRKPTDWRRKLSWGRRQMHWKPSAHHRWTSQAAPSSRRSDSQIVAHCGDGCWWRLHTRRYWPPPLKKAPCRRRPSAKQDHRHHCWRHCLRPY